jgi:hypothetical protein
VTADVARFDQGSARVRRRSGCRGTSLVTLSGALLVFLLLMFFAVQLTVDLYTRSQVTAAGFDAARRVARYENEGQRDAAAVDAEARLRSSLGSMGDDVRVEWELSDPNVVRVRLVLAAPSIAPALVRDAVGLEVVDRTITVRAEREQ